jgi:hypothetical protein
VSQGSNQYPRLPWQRYDHPTAAPAFVAYPHGPDSGWAKVVFMDTYPTATPWAWIVNWDDRFSGHGSAPSKQEAADWATRAYWDSMVETESWRPVPRPAVGEPQRCLPELRFRAWVQELARNMTNETAPRLVGQFLRAVHQGPSIAGNKAADRWAHRVLSDAFGTRAYLKQ